MAKLSNYFFGKKGIRRITQLVDYRQDNSLSEDNVSLAGNCYGKIGFPDGTKLITSNVSRVCGMAYTHSGSVYELEDMDPDYADFLSAINVGIPVLHDWDISGTADTGYTFYALDETNQCISGKILKQEGNYLYLNIDGDETKFFIDWLCIDYDDIASLLSSGNIPNSDITLDRFEMFCDVKCRPVLFPGK